MSEPATEPGSGTGPVSPDGGGAPATRRNGGKSPYWAPLCRGDRCEANRLTGPIGHSYAPAGGWIRQSAHPPLPLTGGTVIDTASAPIAPPADGNVTFVPLAAAHEAGWRRLWTGFAVALTGTAPADEAVAQTWRWLCDPAHPLEGLVAIDADGQLVGLAQYYAVARPLIGRESGYLADLYVEPSCRGRGIGRALFAAVMEIGRGRGWAKFRWVTPADNHVAVALYDQIAHRVPMVVYDFEL